MSTLIYHKYVLVPRGVNPNFQNITDQRVKDLMRGKKTCIIQAGLPLEVSSQGLGRFLITRVGNLDLDDQGKFKAGDMIVGQGFLATADEVGKTKIIDKLDPQTNQVLEVKYQVKFFSHCF